MCSMNTIVFAEIGSFLHPLADDNLQLIVFFADKGLSVSFWKGSCRNFRDRTVFILNFWKGSCDGVWLQLT